MDRPGDEPGLRVHQDIERAVSVRRTGAHGEGKGVGIVYPKFTLFLWNGWEFSAFPRIRHVITVILEEV